MRPRAGKPYEPEVNYWLLATEPGEDLEVAEIPAPLWNRLIELSHEGLAQVARERA